MTRALSIFINSNPFSKAQFILSTHDVKLLSPVLFRKDQIYFINRYEKSVEMVSLDMFKSNSEVDVRSNSNYEKIYVEGKIVDLPYTDIYSVIKEFEKSEKKA